MKIRLSKKLMFLIFLFLLSCKRENQESRIKDKAVQQIKNKTDFFDKKFENTAFSLIIDESNIADHPIKSYLDCKRDGYFTLHYVPKTKKLQHFWKDQFFENYDFDTINLEKDDKKLRDLLDNEKDYNIFSYQIKKEYLKSNGPCSEESVYAKQNTVASIYYYNSTAKNWDLLKKVKSEELPPYPDLNFFINNFPGYFPENKAYNSNKRSYTWNGIYSVNIDYGKLDEISKMSINYSIEINDGNCLFSGMGYKTYFTDQCKVEEKKDVLILKYDKNIEGDSFSDHSDIDILGIIKFKNNTYYVKSPIIANSDWNYNTELALIKK